MNKESLITPAFNFAVGFAVLISIITCSFFIAPAFTLSIYIPCAILLYDTYKIKNPKQRKLYYIILICSQIIVFIYLILGFTKSEMPNITGLFLGIIAALFPYLIIKLHRFINFSNSLFITDLFMLLLLCTPILYFYVFKLSFGTLAFDGFGLFYIIIILVNILPYSVLFNADKPRFWMSGIGQLIIIIFNLMSYYDYGDYYSTANFIEQLSYKQIIQYILMIVSVIIFSISFNIFYNKYMLKKHKD